MDFFEYVMVLASIIIGLALTHVLQGILELIQERRRPYWVHLAWVTWAFTQAVFWWWWEFRFHTVETWTLPLYAFVIGYAFVLYLMCGMLFPKNIDEYGDFKTYFYARRAWFFGLVAAIFAIDLLDTSLKGWSYFLGLGPEYIIATVSLLLLNIVAAFVRNERFHGVFAVLVLVYSTSWALRHFYSGV